MDSNQWLGLELRHLAALVAVAREGSFRRAAARLGYVPSAISAQIAGLEKVVNERLVERSRGPGDIALTEAGQLLLAHAESILSRVHAAQTELASVSRNAARSLRIGVVQSIGLQLLPALIRELSQRAKELELAPFEADDDRVLYDMVEKGDLDLTFAELPPPGGPFAHMALLEDRYVLLVRVAAVPSPTSPVSLQEIARLPLVAYRHCRGTVQLETQLQAKGLRPRFVFRSNTNATLQALVAGGVGAALMPRLAIDEADPRTVALDLADDVGVARRDLGLVWHAHRDRSKQMRLFASCAKEVCERTAKTMPYLLAADG